MFIFLILMLVPLFIPTIFIPYWTRKTESFGVSIPEEVYVQSNIKQMRKTYAWSASVLAIILTAILAWLGSGMSENKIAGLYTAMIFIFLAASFALYLFFHGKMKKLKEQNPDWMRKQQKITVNTQFRHQKLTYSNYWFVIHLAVSFATMIFTLLHYDDIPARFPTQYDFNGEVTSWSTKSYRSVMLMPILQIYLTLLMLFINVVIAKAKQQVSSANPEESLQKNIVFRRRWSLFTILTGLALILILTVPQLSLFYQIDSKLQLYVPILFTLVICIGAIVLSITTGQGGSRVRSVVSTVNGDLIDRDDDQHWKLGVFYFNRNDPAIFLEKRFGVGWTNNWAHPLSWIILAAIIFLATGLPLFLG